MLKPTNSSSSLTLMRHSLTTSLTSSTAVWIIEQKNINSTIIENSQSGVRIMWYRFLLIIVIFITAFGNLLVCLAIARERKLQNTTNYFLMSLAIADCLVAILVMPMGMIVEVLGYFPLPHYACIIFATMDVLCCTSSIWHMSTMSMDRYFTIRFPFRYGRNKTRRIMLLKIIGVWAISFAVSSPVFVLGIIDQDSVLSNGVCAPNNAFFKIYGSIFAFYIPFLIMIITYALTMRSLRNVLVNKKKYDRERRQKQTFRPLAQIINQYAEIAQGIRRTSAIKKSPLSPTLINTNTNHSNSLLSKTPFSIITTTSPTDSRGQYFSSNNNLNLQQETTTINQTNGTNNTNNELIHHNSQHLTISYKKPSGNKKRRYQQQQQQQQLQQNLSSNRTKNDLDMSTVYEITENSKSTSSCYDVSAILNTNYGRRSIISFNNDQKPMKIDETIEPTPVLTNANDISTVKEEERSSISDFDSEIDGNECLETQINLTRSHPIESILLNISWKSCIEIIRTITFYYMSYFPYRLRPLSIEYPHVNNIDRSTSTSSLHFHSIKTYRTNSTQTNAYGLVDYNQTNVSGHYNTLNAHKRRRFPFHRPLIPASSLLTNLFRQSPTPPVRSSESSTKSSLSWGQRSSAASSSNQMRQSYALNSFRRIESSEIESIQPPDRRSRASTSSSCLLHTTYRHGSSVYTHYHKPLARQQYQSHSAHVLPHVPTTRSLFHQQLSSATNTNSSDSSSAIHRYQSRFFSNMSNPHRTRDEDIVAANERKALRVLMIIFCVFVTLWTPFFICTFVSAICYECRERISPSMWFSITWLGYGSSMANPFIYTIFSDVFRRAFLNIICCRSKETFIVSRRYSTKYSSPKYGAQQNLTQNLVNRRSQNQDLSGASTPVPLQQPTTIGGSDAMIYAHRCASDTFR